MREDIPILINLNALTPTSAPRELAHQDLAFDFEPEVTQLLTQDSDTLGGVIGQPRAMKALQLGTAIHSPGYNIFVTGETGTGRQTAVRKVLAQQSVDPSRINDLAYAFNFQKPEQPQVLRLPPGTANQFKAQLHELVEKLKTSIPQELGSDLFKSQKDSIVRATEEEENHRISDFESRLLKDGFKIVQYEPEEEDEEPRTMDILPLWEGQPVSFDDLQGMIAEGKLTEQDWAKSREKYYAHMDEMKALFGQLRLFRADLEKRLNAMETAYIKKSVHQVIQKIQKKHPQGDVKTYLQDLEKDILANLFLFKNEKPVTDLWGNPALHRYGVNVLLDHGENPVLPVVFENRPTPANLFGVLESRMEPGGESRTSFLMIRPGSLIRASGGYLILRAEDILAQEEAWPGLKRALETNQVEIQTTSNPFNPAPSPLKPDPVPVKVKVIILGSEGLYDYLAEHDNDFTKLFKISAEFDSVMARTPRTTREYLNFMDQMVTKHSLLPLTAGGRAEILEYGVRLADHRNKLSTQFSLIADLLIESSYWASQAGLKEISREAVQTAQKERTYLYSLPEEKMDEQVDSGQILISVRGTAVGQVNGLAVLDRGTYSFGRPLRITATAGPGEDGIINVEAEAGLSGEIHNKGVLILQGLIHNRFALHFPLSFLASIAFEQNYGGVDGDSASSTEAYALISAIARIPLRQDLAVSGSINQMGEIQPVGGITQKVEGFFHVCQRLGLTGTQGVIIPHWNIQNLSVNREVQEAVKEGKFHIYPIKTMEEGLQLLTGMDLGVADAEGKFPEGTLGYLVSTRLRKMLASLHPKE